MTKFQVGDRVRYVNDTASAVFSARGEIGTVIVVEHNRLEVIFDKSCWNGRNIGAATGLWKWELVETLTPQEKVLKKIKSLDQRFKNKTLPKTTMKPLDLPR